MQCEVEVKVEGGAAQFYHDSNEKCHRDMRKQKECGGSVLAFLFDHYYYYDVIACSVHSVVSATA